MRLFHHPAIVPFVFCLFSLLLSATLSAQPTQPEHTPASVAHLTLDGEVLFALAGTPSYPASDRIENIRNRIVQVADNPAFREQDITIQATASDGIAVMAGSRQLLVIFQNDADFEGVSMETMAEVARSQIVEALASYRAYRTPNYLINAGLKSAAALGIAMVFIWLVLRLFRRLFKSLERRFKGNVQDLKIDSFEVIRAENIWNLVAGVLFFIRATLVLVAFYLAVEYALYQFPWTRATANALIEMVIGPLETMATAFLDYLPKLIFLIILVAIARYLLKLMHLFFRGVERGRIELSGFDPEWAPPTYRLLRTFTILLTIVLAYPYIPGSGSAAFQGLSILVGIMVSLGASSAVSSVVAGYALTYRRAFKIGDLIEVGEHRGVVVESRLLVTQLRTLKNEEVVLPNSMLLNTPVTNLSRPAQQDGLILHTTVGIGYETPWRQVEAMLKEAAARTRSLNAKPAPFILVKELGDFAISYELNVYIAKPEHLAHRYTELHRNILDVFNEYGVAIMTPAYRADTQEPKLVPTENWYLAPAKPPETVEEPQKNDN